MLPPSLRSYSNGWVNIKQVGGSDVYTAKPKGVRSSGMIFKKFIMLL